MGDRAALTQVDLHARAADEVHGATLDRLAQRLGRAPAGRARVRVRVG